MGLVDEKAVEVREMLEAWALENKVLGPGEQLVFTLRVDRVALAVRKEVADDRNMKIGDFFTRERAQKAGYAGGIGVRAFNVIRGLADYRSPERDKLHGFTVQQLSEWQPFRTAMHQRSRWSNAGGVTRAAIRKMLAEVGLEV